MSTRVGVYGTLKQGHGNHRLLAHVPVTATGFVRGHRLYEAGIPFLVDDDTSEYDVLVEIYDVDDDTLQSLDWLEGHPTCYCRKELEVFLEDGTSTECWIYEYPNPAGRENTTGIFPLENSL